MANDTTSITPMPSSGSQPGALTPLVPLPPGSRIVSGNDGLGARWASMPARVQLLALLGLGALVAVLVVMFGGARDSDFRPLFPNLSEKDGGQIIDKLAQMNVPYRFAEGGSTIMVPSAKVHELRMKLAASGLPSAGSTGSGSGGGYELLDKNSFGQTQGQERMKMQRAIEGELTTTIQSLESVRTARVHLALPPVNGFFREQQKPSASVVLTLHPGRTLDRGQVAGIVRVVSGSVAELTAKAVSVVDSSGSLLSGSAEDEAAQGLDSQQLQFRREVESGHLKRVLALLEPVVGPQNLRASVTAEIDFSQVMRTDEAYGPNQGADAKATVREQRSEESTTPGGAAAGGGVPGATSNQPPTPASAPISGVAQVLQAAGPNGGPGAVGGSPARREAATRFEVDKTVTVTRSAVGTVRRLNAAVVVNHRSSTDAKGKTTSAPLTDKEIEQLTALVQQGIGFNAERGDVVKVINAPFKVDAATPVDELPLWQQPWLVDLLKTAAAPLALALVALVIVSRLLKPALTAVLAPPALPAPGSQLDAVVDGEVEVEPSPIVSASARAAIAGPSQNLKLEAVRAMAKQNPAAVAHIVRGWVNG
ncbi:MAG: flagellar basal-body MS-ring/collar protein FliF [Rubrivivax sp.]